MKIRSGFVSNSSSSSFVVGFPKRPKSVDEVRKWLFDDESEVTYYDYSMSTWDIAARVFEDIKRQKRAASKTQILEKIKEGYFDGVPEYSYHDSESAKVRKEFNSKFPKAEMYGENAPKDPEAVALIEKCFKLQNEEWAAYNKKRDEAAEDYLRFVLSKMEGKKVFLFSYADDGGEALLEHGDIFQNLPHVQISCH